MTDVPGIDPRGFPRLRMNSAIGAYSMQARRWGVGLMMALGLGLSGCGEREFVRESYVFGTRVEISAVGVDEDKAAPVVDAALGELDRLHRDLHAWQPGPVMDMNAAFAAARPAAVTAEMADLIAWSQWSYRQSDGLFNPAVGGLISAWGFHGDRFDARPPNAAVIQRWVSAAPTPLDVQVDRLRATSRNPAVRLDFGGIAKGWALDRLARRLRSGGIRNALINIGGNVMALGQRGQRPWRVGLQHPRKPEAMLELDLRDGEAIGTSGDYQRFFLANGRRYSHLIDPRSGRPSARSMSATVIGPPGSHAGLISDVASKPLFIGGSERAGSLMRRFGVKDWLVVNPDGTVYLSKTMQTRVHWLGSPPKAVVTGAGVG